MGGGIVEDQILNLEQAMELFGVSERTIIKLLREEHIPARKIGREWRFSKAALMAWLAEGDSVNYLNQPEQYRVYEDTSAPLGEIMEKIQHSLQVLRENQGRVSKILPKAEENISLPGRATLRVSYKKQRDLKKLTFKIFWLD